VAGRLLAAWREVHTRWVLKALQVRGAGACGAGRGDGALCVAYRNMNREPMVPASALKIPSGLLCIGLVLLQGG
jgi:hypothetical protein